MQNKPNLPDAQMNVTSFITKDYENERLRRAGKTNPIQTQYKANTNPKRTQNKPNTNPIYAIGIKPKKSPAILMFSFPLLLICKQFVQ